MGPHVHQALPEHRTTLAELFGGGDEEDDKLAENAARWTPGGVVRRRAQLPSRQVAVSLVATAKSQRVVRDRKALLNLAGAPSL